jgi:hypothetical protein
VYLLNFQNKETALSLKNEIEKSINKNSFPSNTIINEIQQGFSRIELIKNAEITSQHFVVAKNSIFPVSNIDVISKVGWPTDLIFSSNQLFSSSKYSKEANYEQGTISKFSSSWYHFLIDCLPLLLKYRNQLEEIPYLFFGEIPSQIREILIAITGINPIMLPNNNTIRVKSLTFLQDYRFHDLYDFSKRREDIDNVRKFLVGEKNDKNGTYATRKILLARETGLFRQLKNSSEVYQLLSDFGFEILYPNKINLEEQIKLYSQTRILVSETGASLVNTIFLPDKSTVIELKFGEIVGHIWPNFIAQSNLNYLQCQMRVNKFTGQGHLDIKQLSSILMKIK